MNIVIAGYGPVGKAAEHALKKNINVETYIDDPYKNRQLDPYILYADLVDAVVVCVATPMGDDGRCVTENVQDVFDKYGKDCKYLIKSTTDPLFLVEAAKTYDITMSPEYLRGTTGNDPTEDFMNQEFAVYGGENARWWHELFKPTLLNLKDENVRFVSLEQAAFAKYALNCFLATKVTYFNEIYQAYKAMGFTGFDGMIDALCLDPRVGRSHTQVPGPDGEFGYGGHCFPKDMSGLISATESVNMNPELLKAVRDYNTKVRNDDE